MVLGWLSKGSEGYDDGKSIGLAEKRSSNSGIVEDDGTKAMGAQDGQSLGRKRSRSRRQTVGYGELVLISSLISGVPLASAQKDTCLSLAESKACSAFKEGTISTTLTGEYPFLTFVGNVEQFDEQLEIYVRQGYAQKQYQNRFGCSDIELSNTTSAYARFTTSVLCSAMVYDSRNACGVAEEDAPTLCASDCADWATSEQIIVADNKTCGISNPSAMDEIRSDFVVCSLPNESLSENCIKAASNEPDNCGFNDNLQGLCYYCSKQKESPTSTDSCCHHANAEERCVGIELPSIPSLPPLPTDNNDPNGKRGKKSALSGGAIAGIVVGGVVGLGAVVFAVWLCMRRRNRPTPPAFLSQPSPRQGSRGAHSMGFHPVSSQGQGYEVLQGPGRIARMAALEHNMSSETASPPPLPVGGRRRRHMERASSSDFGLEESPSRRGPIRDRQASLSSASILMSERNTMDPSSPLPESEKSPTSQQFASPTQSEQLGAFKDYYSKDEIRPGDKVAVLWAYSPRAPDEFELERGDVLKVVGIWDDGWATGIMLNERAEDLALTRHRSQRDSGVSASQSSQRHGRRPSSPTPASRDGAVKAFPLVCVCLPEHWQKTIDSEGAQSMPSSPGGGGFASDIPEAERESSSNPSSPEKRMQQKGSSRFHEDYNPSA